MKQKIPVNSLEPNPWNPNIMRDEEYEKLKESIEVSNGIYLEDNPILARPIEDAYQIVDGEHRWRVATDLEYEDVWCTIREMDDETAMELCVILNKDRGQISYFKLSKLLNEFYKKYSHGEGSQADLGKKFGYSGSMVSYILPIFPKLKIFDHDQRFHNLSNRTLVQLARIKNNQFRELVVNLITGGRHIPSTTLQKIATNLNELGSYLEEKITDEAVRDRVLKRLLDIGESFIDYGNTAMKNEVNLFYKEELRKRIIHGDMFEEIDKLEIEFDCIYTDPPYGISYNNLIELKDRKDHDRDFGEWDHFTREEYLTFTEKWVKKVVDVLKPGGTMIIHISDEYLSHVMDVLRENGMKKRNTLIWQKRNPAPAVTQTNFVSSSEFIIYATKDKQKTFNWYGQKKMYDILPYPVISVTENLGHPSQKPIELVERILKSVTDVGDMVLDPFAGTGSTAVACENLGRGWVMIEKEEKYFKLMERRLLK